MKNSVRQQASWLSTPAQLPETDQGWLNFVDTIGSTGLAGLALSSIEIERAPSWVILALRAGASKVGAANVRAIEELARIAREFERADIRLMALKGAALNLTIYPRRDLRPMSDLDLLVAPQDALQAIEILEAIGYRSGASLIRDDFFPTHHYERELILPGAHPVRVDLHAHPWRPMHLSQVVSPEAFWKDAVRVPIENTNILVPDPATMFVHLAAHAAFHDCSRFIWLYDLKLVAEHYGGGLDWSLVVERARKWHLALAVQRALGEAQILFGEVCPPAVSHQLADVRSGLRDRLTLWHMPRDASSPMLHVVCNLICLRGIRKRVAYLAAMLWPDKSHLAESYPLRHPGWTCCAQLVRGMRALGRVVAAPLSTIRKSPIRPHQQGVPC